jgi:hypothetical protein
MQKTKKRKRFFLFLALLRLCAKKNTPIAKGLAVLAVVFWCAAPCRIGMKRVGSYFFSMLEN